MFNPRNMDYHNPIEEWDMIPFNESDLLLPSDSGVYVVTSELDQILYVGEAKNLIRRWQGHNMVLPCIRYGAVDMSYFLTDKHKELERHLIYYLRPLLNRRNNTKKAEESYIQEYGYKPFIFRASEW